MSIATRRGRGGRGLLWLDRGLRGGRHGPGGPRGGDRVRWRPVSAGGVAAYAERSRCGRVAVGRVRVVNESARRSGSTLMEVTIGRGSGEFLVPRLAGTGLEQGLLGDGEASRRQRGSGAHGAYGWQGLLRRVRQWDPILVHVHPPTVRFPLTRRAYEWTSRAWPAKLTKLGRVLPRPAGRARR